MWSLSQSSWLRREAGNGHARRRYRTLFSDQMSYRPSASSTSALVWREASAHSNAAAWLRRDPPVGAAGLPASEEYDVEVGRNELGHATDRGTSARGELAQRISPGPAFGNVR